MNPIVYLIDLLLSLLSWGLFIYLIMQWLIHFRVINYSNRVIYEIYQMLSRLLEPVLGWVRRYVPLVNGLDLSPIVVFIAISFIRYTLFYYSY